MRKRFFLSFCLLIGLFLFNQSIFAQQVYPTRYITGKVVDNYGYPDHYVTVSAYPTGGQCYDFTEGHATPGFGPGTYAIQVPLNCSQVVYITNLRFYSSFSPSAYILDFATSSYDNIDFFVYW